ncbi:MAG: RHS repeat domain-containing protein [Pseudomonadota bacterium]|nr:RHS repeat domain-containing protein [Pseudomonadota bacterium]
MLNRLTQITDALNRSTDYHYDALNRLVKSIDALGGISQQRFDADDNYARENSPECRIKYNKGICTKLECIDAYHNQCFENCDVSWHCYGGNYDGWLSPNFFYDAPGWLFDSSCEDNYSICE